MCFVLFTMVFTATGTLKTENSAAFLRTFQSILSHRAPKIECAERALHDTMTDH